MLKYFVAVFVVAVLGAGAFFAVDATRTPPFEADAPDTEQIVFWESRIEDEGSTKAYAEFADAIAEQDIARQHTLAHAFGYALFDAEGVPGIAACDAQFSFGCFHSFLASAITTLGVESVPMLNDKCYDALVTTPLSCQHGIGHGVLAYYGYDEDALHDALEQCRGLDKSDPIGGCYGGVFMEYNVRTVHSDQPGPREYTGNPFEPCDAVEDTYRMPCVYWSSQWWTQAIFNGKISDASYATMGDYCRHWTETEVLRACFEGIGTLTPNNAVYDAARAIALCTAATANEREELWCRSTAANVFFVEVSREEAEKVCSGYDGNSRTTCLAYARNEANAVNQVPTDL